MEEGGGERWWGVRVRMAKEGGGGMGVAEERGVGVEEGQERTKRSERGR